MLVVASLRVMGTSGLCQALEAYSHSMFPLDELVAASESLPVERLHCMLLWTLCDSDQDRCFGT